MTVLLDQLLDDVRVRKTLPKPDIRRGLRLLAGLSQGDIARTLGVTCATVSRWESGQREPSGRRGVAYARLLEALVHELEGLDARGVGGGITR